MLFWKKIQSVKYIRIFEKHILLIYKYMKRKHEFEEMSSLGDTPTRDWKLLNLSVSVFQK